MDDMQCKLRSKCPDQSQDLHNCWRDDCGGRIHEGCCQFILDKYEIDPKQRPTVEDRVEPDVPVVFCTKTCFLKFRAYKNRAIKALKSGEEAKKRAKVPWEEDGSLGVLMEWITTHGNYACYCGSSGNRGLTKTAHHKLIADLIKKKIPQSERNEKDVENKITALERSFRKAVDWLNNTGQGVENPGDIEQAIKKRCPHYEELEPIMGERPNAKPLSTSEMLSSDDEDIAFPIETVQGSAVQAMAVNQSVQATTPTQGSASSVTNSAGSKRLASAAATESRKKNKNSADDFISSYLGNGDDDGPDSFHSLRVREVSAREKEASARMMEAEALSQKTKKETALLSIDERVKLARERKKLVEDGVCTVEELDGILPFNN